MTDKKVIVRALEEAKLRSHLFGDGAVSLTEWFINDLLDILKDEPVEPKKSLGALRDCCSQEMVPVCGNCNGGLHPAFKYCPYCGRPVKWKEY